MNLKPFSTDHVAEIHMNFNVLICLHIYVDEIRK